MNAVYGSKKHQELVSEVLDESFFMPRTSTYMTHYFWDRDYKNFSRIEDECLLTFTDKINAAAAAYLERQMMQEVQK
tara:strand:- start:498 stop:728 length:231 start_codon:yes stop_codon:yes gene_type:complete